MKIAIIGGGPTGLMAAEATIAGGEGGSSLWLSGRAVCLRRVWMGFQNLGSV
jgi:predicted flavoprotein YhiN